MSESPEHTDAKHQAGWSERRWWRQLTGRTAITDSDAPADPTAAITLAPDPRKWRTRRSVFPAGVLRRTWDKLVVPADPPEGFASESLGDLEAKLRTTDEAVAAAILAEAEQAYREPQELIESAERRATTLQGTVAIAASVALAGAGLLLDPTRVPSRSWRVAIVVALALFVLCLLGCAVRALGATVRIFNYEEPGYERIVDRVSMSGPAAMTSRAAELLRAAAVADMIGSVKVGLLRPAAWWFRLALLLLAALTAIVGAYALSDAATSTHRTSGSNATNARSASRSTTTPTAKDRGRSRTPANTVAP